MLIFQLFFFFLNYCDTLKSCKKTFILCLRKVDNLMVRASLRLKNRTISECHVKMIWTSWPRLFKSTPALKAAIFAALLLKITLTACHWTLYWNRKKASKGCSGGPHKKASLIPILPTRGQCHTTGFQRTSSLLKLTTVRSECKQTEETSRQHISDLVHCEVASFKSAHSGSWRGARPTALYVYSIKLYLYCTASIHLY